MTDRTQDYALPPDKLYRVSIGMMSRTVIANNPFSACHKCGLGSGDLQMAQIEELDPITEKVLYRGGFRNE